MANSQKPQEERYKRFVTLLTRNDQAIRRFVRSLLPSQEGVDDAVQDTALVVCSSSPGSTYGTILGLKGQAKVVLGRDKYDAPCPQAITSMVDKNHTPAWRRIVLDAKPLNVHVPVLWTIP